MSSKPGYWYIGYAAGWHFYLEDGMVYGRYVDSCPQYLADHVSSPEAAYNFLESLFDEILPF